MKLIKNIANSLTIFRIVLVPIFLFFLLQKNLLSIIFALFIFIIAAITDLYDGYLARNRNEITNFGIIMDPVADKLIVLSAFISFVQLDMVSSWMVIVIVAREFLITILRTLALAKNKVLGSIKSGKYKTVSHMVIIILILAIITFDRIFGVKLEEIEVVLVALPYLLVFVAMVTSIISGVEFILQNKKIVIE